MASLGMKAYWSATWEEKKKDNCIKFIRFEVCITTFSFLVAWAEFIFWKNCLLRKWQLGENLVLFFWLKSSSSKGPKKKSYRSVSPFLSAMLSRASSYLSVSGSLDVDWVDDIKELFHHGHFLVDKVDFTVHGLQHILIQLSRQFLDRYYISLLFGCFHNNEKSLSLHRWCWARATG